jgi:8-oxo-dGTP diphosphatase
VTGNPYSPPHYCAACGALTEARLIEERMRPVCTVCGQVAYLDPKLAVAVIIFRDDRVLLGKRGMHGREPGKWSFPAGFVERGERVEDAAVRETREETGLQIEIDDLIGLFSETGDPVVLAVYGGHILDGEPHAADDLTELGWYRFTDLPELAFSRDQQILDAWRAKG